MKYENSKIVYISLLKIIKYYCIIDILKFIIIIIVIIILVFYNCIIIYRKSSNNNNSQLQLSFIKSIFF